MDINEILKGKSIPLGAIIIIITYLAGGLSTSILPFVFFTGILMGFIKNKDKVEALVAGLITAFIGSIITTIINVAFMYLLYGSAYVTYLLTNSLYLIILYLIVGAIGGIIGYYVSEEIKQ